MNVYGRNGMHLTESFESCVLTPYWDAMGKVWSDGWGNTNGVVPHGPPITQAKADADLLRNVQHAVDVVNRLVHVPLTQNQFDALVDFTFNAGETNFATSTMLRLLNAGDEAGAAAQFKRWDMAGGAHIAGLARRRKAEADLFNT